GVELGCPATRLTTTPVGAGGYVVQGCGRRQSYTCVTQMRGWGFGAHREVICAPDGPAQTTGTVAAAPSAPDTRTSSTSLEDARVALGAIASCPPVERTATIEITIGPDGVATRIDTPGIPVATGTCLVTALRSALFPTRRTT